MNATAGTYEDSLDTPCLCIDLPLMEENIARMAAFFRERPAVLRPHTKTHKSPVLARRQIAAGAIGITCAKLGEAEVMAQGGIDDILIANQVVGGKKISRLANLAAYTRVTVAVDDAKNVAELDEAARVKGTEIGILVEIDIGMGRCGVEPGQAAVALARQAAAAPGLRFEGIMGYEGHTVMIADRQERKQRTEAALALLLEARNLIEEAGLPVSVVSGGGTGTYDITSAYPGITEVQAGSYITMDTQYRDAVGIDFACALFVTAQVISAQRPDTVIIDAGLKSLTRDFGLPVVAEPGGWRLVGLSEEHGFLKREGGRHLVPGDRVKIWPNHGCTTINLHDRYLALRNGIVEGNWPVAGRGKAQ
jgi:D-serine deaminase-like pyridoxal phosphate-dependent protein